MVKAPKECPHCGKTIPVQALRIERPFSCPSCGQLVSPSNPYARIGTVGCFSFLLLSVTLAAYWGVRVSNGASVGRLLLGMVVGIVGGVTLANAITWILDRRFPRPPTLGKHELREEPQLVVEVADFLDSIVGAQEWTSEQDLKLESIWKQRSLDEDLVNEALMAAKELRSRLRGEDERVKHLSGEIRTLTLDELRLELAAIARDLRVAAQ